MQLFRVVANAALVVIVVVAWVWCGSGCGVGAGIAYFRGCISYLLVPLALGRLASPRGEGAFLETRDGAHGTIVLM